MGGGELPLESLYKHTIEHLYVGWRWDMLIFVAWEVLQALRIESLEEGAPQVALWA